MNEQELKEIEDWNNKICICCESSKCCDRSKKIPKLIQEIRRLQDKAGGCSHSIRGKNLETCASCCRSHARALDAAAAKTNGPL